jgi:hypothetical protein
MAPPVARLRLSGNKDGSSHQVRNILKSAIEWRAFTP